MPFMEYNKLRNNKARREIFNLKNKECQSNFFEETNKGFRFQQCFNSGQNFEDKCRKFVNTLDDTLHKCF